METASYFLRYFPPAMLSLIAVALAAGLNHVMGPLVWAGRVAEPLEVLAYSVRTSGPLVFAFAFVALFYGMDALEDGFVFSKIACISGLVLLVATIAAGVACIPRTGTGQ